MTTRPASQWWDRSWNPVTGCTPAGAGCDHCHALQRMRRHLPALRGAGNARVPETQVLCHPERLCIPLKRRAPTVWLVSMLGDVFHDDVPATFVAELLNAIDQCDKHTFCLLTKRPARAAKWMADYDGAPAKNMLLLASVWDQPSADAACAALSQLRGVRWGLHVEPMLGPINLGNVSRWPFKESVRALGRSIGEYVSWVVCGAEQGPGARPFDLDWARSLRDQCRAAAVPFWFKSGQRRSEPPPDLLVRETPWEQGGRR